MKRAVKSLAKAPESPVQSDPVTRIRMDLEHAMIAAGGSMMQTRAIVRLIDQLILLRISEAALRSNKESK